MRGMQELARLRQEHEHVNTRAIGRRLISVHHVADHSYMALYSPFVKLLPSNRNKAFVIHPFRGFEFGQVGAHIHGDKDIRE